MGVDSLMTVKLCAETCGSNERLCVCVVCVCCGVCIWCVCVCVVCACVVCVCVCE
jgi:hypothetical protein